MSDAYSRFDYRRVIAWPKRIEREWSFLRRFLEAGPSRRILDLGCGTGEHARFLASHDFEVIGIDSSPGMIRRARDTPYPENLDLIEGDLRELDHLTSGSFGGALCLGNTLPHLTTDSALAQFLGALRRRLAPSAAAVFQLLNYERIISANERSLPLNFRPDEDGEIVFLRLMTHHPDGMVSFYPSTLRLDPKADLPLQIEASKRVDLRGWRCDELDAAFSEAGFKNRDTFGAFDASSFVADESQDLILVVR
jgi:SAM-dependent methyltransferase